MDIIFIEVIKILGGYTIILYALVKWMGDIESQKIILSLESNLARKQKIEDSVRSLLSQSFANNQTLFMDKNIKGIEGLWGNFLKIRHKMPSFLIYVDITTKDEYQSILRKSGFKSAVAEWESIKYDVMKDLNSNDVEIFRPFIGEYLWAIFFSYRAFFLRLTMLVLKDASIQSPRYWKEDEGLRKNFYQYLKKRNSKIFIPRK